MAGMLSDLVIKAELQDDVSKPAKKAKESIEDVKEEVEQLGQAAEKASRQTDKSSSALDRLRGRASQARRTVTGMAESGLGKLTTWGKRSVLAVGAVATAVAGLTIKGGIDRLLGIEDATARLRGLGMTSRQVARATASALASVRGTAFGLADAVGVAADASAVGVKPGKGMTQYLKLVADAATQAQRPLADIGAIFNKVEGEGRVTGEVLAQLTDNKLGGVTAWLAKARGVSIAELRKLASEGKVTSAEFRDAIQKNIGGAALESGKTTRGAFANLKASLGRVGANLLGGVFPSAGKGARRATDWLGPMEKRASGWGKKLGNAMDKAGEALTDFLDKMRAGEGVPGKIGKALDGMGDAASKVFGFLKEHKQTVLIFTGVLAGLTVGIGLLNAVLAINPFTLLVIGVAALITGFILLYKKSETFRALIDFLWNKTLKPWGRFMKEELPPVLKLLGKIFLGLSIVVVAAFTGLYKAVMGVFQGIISSAAGAFGWVPGLGDKLKGAERWFGEFKATTEDALDGLADGIRTGAQKLDDLGKKRPTPKVNLNTESADAKLDRLTRRLRQLEDPNADLSSADRLADSYTNPGVAGADENPLRLPRGDTATRRGHGHGRANVTLGRHHSINRALGGRYRVTNVFTGGGGRGRGSGDHQAGRAVDVTGPNLGRYVQEVRRRGGYATVHGDGAARHAHSVPMGDTATTRRGHGTGAAGAPSVVVHAPVTIYASSDVDVEARLDAWWFKVQRDIEEAED